MESLIPGFESLSASTHFTINSFTFIVFGILSIIFMRPLRFKSSEFFFLFIFNTIFLCFVVGGLQNAIFLTGFLILIYLLAILSRCLQNGVAFVRALAVILLWVVLFLAKDRLLIEGYNPFSYFSITILGLSYITFRGISYIMESHIVQKRSFFDFYNYIVFFPTLISGPIERFTHFYAEKKSIGINDNFNNFMSNLNRILNGCIKKFVLADNLMCFSIFSLGHEPEISIILLWFGALNVLFLIYLDFSGYCDIMLGLAGLMGYKLSENFNYPFVSKNIREFWTRWHISLGSIIQDYVFTPINKYVILNVKRDYHSFWIGVTYLASMILVAMWHGTTLGFLIFGFVHGLVLIFFQLKKRYIKKNSISNGFFSEITLYTSTVLTYSFVSVSLVLWYNSFPHAISTLKKLFGI